MAGNGAGNVTMWQLPGIPGLARATAVEREFTVPQ
jgi:hypothetical protein